MEALCKTCCNGMCPLQVTKDRPIFACIEYIPGIMVGEIVDRSNKHFKKGNEKGQMCETCRHYNNSTHWCSQYNDTTYSSICSSYQVKEG